MLSSDLQCEHCSINPISTICFRIFLERELKEKERLIREQASTIRKYESAFKSIYQFAIESLTGEK